MSRRRWSSHQVFGVLILLVTGTDVSAASWADRLFVETGHDFGAVPRGSKVRHNFVLKNNQAEALTILDVHASCGCTTGKALKQVVAPGDTAIVEAEMDTRNFVGRKATVLFVALVSASGKQAEARLNVASTILSDIVLNPGTIDFGLVARGQTPSLILAIDRINAPAWKIERMLSASKAIDATCTEIKRNGQMVSYQLKVSLKPNLTAGTIRDEIKLTTNDRESPAFTIPLTAVIRGDLSASPAVVALGSVNSVRGAQAKYLVRASRPFKIESIEGSSDGFLLTPDNQESRPVHLLSLNYKAEAGTTRGDLRHGFKVKTDLADEAPLDLSATLHVDP